MTYRSRSPEFWDAVEIDYRGGSKLADLFERHGLTKGEFDHHRRTANWPVRNKAPINRDRLVGRIYWLINHHLRAMEKEVDEGRLADLRLLNQLVGSLGKLLRFETGSASAGTDKERTRDLRDMREKLVRRIEELKRD